jgi:hypothetical protein
MPFKPESIKRLKCVAAKLSGFTLAAALTLTTVQAEEGGSGHYMPGSMASSIDGVPPTETVITRLNLLTYNAEFDKGITVPIAGLVAAEVEIETQAVGLTALWRPPIEMGGKWSYAMSATVSFVSLDVTARVLPGNLPPGAPAVIANSIKTSDSASGLGDIILMPLMLNYSISPEWDTNFRITAYAPTGSYDVGSLANTGKNFWSLEPTIASIYINPKNGREFSIFAGIDFNQENKDTNYKSGNQAHIEATFIQHLPLWGGIGGIGATGYWYQQVTGDSGSGATHGDFKAKTVGVGPVLAYSTKAGKTDIVAELKWLHELDTKRRAKGDTIFFKILAKF